MTSPPSAAPKTATKTRYVVLEQTSDTNWAILHTIPADSAEQAIRKTVEGTSDDYRRSSHKIVAVPTRSWQPVDVTVETKTTIKLG